MKLSEIPEYKSAVIAAVMGDLESARQAYQQLLEQAEAEDDPGAISYLMQSLGDVEAQDGNLKLGHELHLGAIGQSPGIPLRLILYAKGLARHFGMPEEAEQKLQAAEQMIASDDWDRRADNITPEAYETLIGEVRGQIDQSL